MNRLEWVRSFYITGKSGKGPLVITTKPDTTPSMKQLQDEFGIEIESYVEFIEEDRYEEFSVHMNCGSTNNNERIKKTTSPPTSGDGIYIDGKFPKSFCSLGIFVNEFGEDKNLYATTCFHGLYNGEKLVDDDGNKLEFGERFDKWKKECEDQNSTTYSTSYCFTSKPYQKHAGETSEKGSSLGKFYAGIYDEHHDFGVVKVDEGVARNGIIPETVKYDDLTEKCYISQKIKENRSQQKSLSVFKTGFKTGPNDRDA